jgi:hypothetical protein
LAFLALEFGPGILGPKPYTMMWEVTDGHHTGYVMGTPWVLSKQKQSNLILKKTGSIQNVEQGAMTIQV